MIKIFCVTAQRHFKDFFRVYKVCVCMLFVVPIFINCDEISNITVFESDVNYTTYNDSYENLTIFNQSTTHFDIDNKSSDVATELESAISVTEDSDSSFQSGSNKKILTFLTPDEDICNCDLTSNVCDINCCCDPDCSEDDMQVFSECSHQVLTPDENYCYQKDIIFRNNTVYKMIKDPKSAMFCIVHDNFKHRLRFKDMPILKSHRDLITVLKYKYKSTYSWDTKTTAVFDSSELKAGNSIYIDLKSNKKTLTKQWSLPSSCLSDMCSCSEEVRYLYDFQSSCSYIIGNFKERCQKDEVLSGNHVSDFCISPRSASSYASGSLAELVVHTRMVGSNASDDDAYQSPVQPNSICTEKKNQIMPRNGRDNCENVVTHVHFIVKQDGLSGITGVEVYFKYANVSFEKEVLTQDYSVNFVWSNASESEKKSGNPGYQIGLPILAATNGSDTGLEDEMSRTFYEHGLSVLGRDSNGFCSLFGNRRTIKFGKNLKTGCVLKHKFTKCKDLQIAVSDVLLGPSRRQIFVGVFGNANSSDPDDWIEVFHELADPPGTDENCFASLDLKIDIVYAAVGTMANPQHKIVGVSYHYVKPEFMDLLCGQSCKDITLSTSVSFFDVTLPAVEHYAKVPSIKANLPSDFFYPFLYSRGSTYANNVYIFIVFVMPLLFYHKEFVKSNL